MWQAINPKTFVTSQVAQQSTVTIQAGQEENVETSLTPFWKDSDNFYKSSDVKSTLVFGLAYPETQRWKFQTEAEYQTSVRTAFANLYGGSNLGFILRDSQKGRLSTGAQLNIPRTSLLSSKVPSAMVSTMASSVASAVKQVVGGDQKPLKDTEPHHGQSNEDKSSKTPEDQHGNPDTSTWGGYIPII